MRGIGSLLGLAQRSGCLVSGDVAVREALVRGKAKLLVIAGNATARTKQELSSLAEKYSIPVVVFGTKEHIGALIGKSPRSSAAFLDENMIRAVLGEEKGVRWSGKKPKSWR